MKSPSFTRHDEIYEDKWMTPMIDIVILLLIFLVCASAGGLAESLFATRLAAAGAVPAAAAVPASEKPWVSEVWLRLRHETDRKRTIVALNDRDYDDFGQLRDQLQTLAQLAPESPIILDIAADVPLEDLIRVWDTCRSARFQSIQFAVDAAKLARPAAAAAD